jgi:AbrB family looped-hinge helix DNA binding protein
MVVSSKGQITLPVGVRAKLGIKTGDRIAGEYTKDGFIIKKPLDFFSLEGILQGKMPDNEEELLTQDFGALMLDRK